MSQFCNVRHMQTTTTAKMRRIEQATGQPIRVYLMDAYLVRGQSTTEIAAATGTDKGTVSRWLAKFGIPARPVGTHVKRRAAA
jgi:transposase